MKIFDNVMSILFDNDVSGKVVFLYLFDVNFLKNFRMFFNGCFIGILI